MSVQAITEHTVLAAIEDGKATPFDLAEHFRLAFWPRELRTALGDLERAGRIRTTVHPVRGSQFRAVELSKERL